MASVSVQPGTGVDEVADGVFRISTPVPMDGVPGGFTFNQYLVLDDEPLLFHTGPRRLFPAVREAVARVLPVDRLRWIGLSHVEADECGALNEWLAVAPHATPLCGRIAAAVSIGDLPDRAPRALGDGESLSLGTRGPSEAFRRPMDYYWTTTLTRATGGVTSSASPPCGPPRWRACTAAPGAGTAARCCARSPTPWRSRGPPQARGARARRASRIRRARNGPRVTKPVK